MRKVEPLERALDGKQAWMTGLRRVESAEPGERRRSCTYDVGRGLVKVNPLATWTDLDVDGYIRDRDLPGAPARRARATRRSAAGRAPGPSATARTPAPDAGPGSDKTECGLHG